MKYAKLLLVLFLTTLTGALHGAQAAQNIDDWQRSIQAQAHSVIRVQTFPTGHTGTAFLLGLMEDTPPQITIVVTARHLLLNADSLFLTLQLVDDNNRVVDKRNIRTALYNSSGDSLFVVGPGSTDLVALVVPTPRVHKDNPASLFTVPETGLRSMRDLFPGQPVFYYGYPLGLAINGIEPFLRSGVIAGVDTTIGVVYLDAQNFPGSSGSPVFLNPTEPINAGAVFVGVISGYLPFIKRLRGEQTGEIEMIQNENSGIATVMPADALFRLGQEALSRHNAMAEKR